MIAARMAGNAYVPRLEALALRRGLSLGGMHSASPVDFALMLAAAAQGFAHGQVYTERDAQRREARKAQRAKAAGGVS